MRRLAATLRWDVLRQYRSGFYAVTAFLVPLSVVLLRWAGGALAAEVVPPLIVVLLLITTFYFAGAILLL
jgi:fluoroquinolone transport system permease protein